MRLQFVEARVLGQELLEIFGAAEGVEVDEYGVVLDVARVLRADVQRVGVHRHDLLAYLLRLFGEVDAVAERLAHLRLAVGAGQAQAGLIVGEHDVRLGERLAVDGVEFMDDFAALFEHRRLILADGDDGRAEGRDVRRLAYRVAEEADWDARLEVAHLDFRLDGRVALDARDRDEVHVVEGQLRQLRYHRLDEDGRFLRVDAAGEIVERYLEDVAADFLGVLRVVGERLRVGYHYVDFVEFPGVLERHAALERAYVMSHVEAARRTVAGQYYLFHRLLLLTIYSARRVFARGLLIRVGYGRFPKKSAVMNYIVKRRLYQHRAARKRKRRPRTGVRTSHAPHAGRINLSLRHERPEFCMKAEALPRSWFLPKFLRRP